MHSSPVQQIEDQEQEWEQDQEGEVRHGVGVLLPSEAVELPELHLEEDAGVLHQGSEYKHDAADHPGFHRCEALSLGLKIIKVFRLKITGIYNMYYLRRISLYCVEDINEHQKYCY